MKGMHRERERGVKAGRMRNKSGARSPAAAQRNGKERTPRGVITRQRTAQILLFAKTSYEKRRTLPLPPRKGTAKNARRAAPQNGKERHKFFSAQRPFMEKGARSPAAAQRHGKKRTPRGAAKRQRTAQILLCAKTSYEKRRALPCRRAKERQRTHAARRRKTAKEGTNFLCAEAFYGKRRALSCRRADMKKRAHALACARGSPKRSAVSFSLWKVI